MRAGSTPDHAPEVLHQDAHLLAVDKPAGMLVHRTSLDAHAGVDLVGWLRNMRGESLWPVHRLDKGTSGVLLLARDATTAGTLGRAFADGEVHKRYLALVRGWPDDAGEIDATLARDPELPSAGQPRLAARTRWRVIERFDWPLRTHRDFATTRCALVGAVPLTGRRHQIRRHFKQIGHPLIGDATHGKGPLNRALAAWLGHRRLWLHALELAFTHPAHGTPMRIECRPGAEWAAMHQPSRTA